MLETSVPISTHMEMERQEALGLRQHHHNFEIGDLVWTWWCPTSECKRRRLANLHTQQQMAEAEVLSSQVEIVLAKIGIKKKYQTCTLDGFHGHPAGVAKARQYVENTGRGSLFITGPTGVGKTHLAVGIIRELAKKGVKNMHFTTAADLLLALREAVSDHGASKEAKIVGVYSGYDILVLDDLCAEKTTEYAATALYMVLNARIGDMKPTIVTSNFTRQDIAEVMPRVASRLAEYEIWDMTGLPDYRRNRK